MRKVSKYSDLLFMVGVRNEKSGYTGEYKIFPYYNLVQCYSSKTSKLSNIIYRKKLIQALTVVKICGKDVFPDSHWVFKPDDIVHFVLGRVHREEVGPDGSCLPAIIESGGRKAWFWHDLPHRIDGPAEIYANGIESFWEYGGPPGTKKPNRFTGVN